MSNHIIIAGTGRAGTSFLVQYLAACGLETHLAANPDDRLDENANAGLEDTPITGYALPYVVKSPWLYEIVDDLVERSDIKIDAVILPMRDIVEAATSRVILEMRARYSKEYLAPQITRWETWGETPGGVVYSLNPVDQARILALGFHETIRALVRKDIPIIFLDFPRLVGDGAYLWGKLERILKDKTDKMHAMRVHAEIADTSKVRAGKEICEPAMQRDTASQFGEISRPKISYPSHDTLDRAALLRELERLRNRLNSMTNDATRLKEESAQAAAIAEQASMKNKSLQSQLEMANQREARLRDDAHAEIENCKAQYSAQSHQISSELQQAYEQRIAADRSQFIAKIELLEQSIAALRDSTSWRATRPLRRLAEWIRRT
ncbi:hypothetical protein SB768_09540 [Burkholderia sp. SIMBA_043]|uniref:hypothetical protein n=1 Tax=Burkholderia TaxID=32008 RepID=UPI0005D7405C|nr:hypothetical protein [Burkholderia vietnamiensis]AJY06777.1 hypothetical protein AK36_3049 [Burkholderia vietnamiensis LMG 10929]MBH9648400.1 hypothetical protein [Burkholderia vietnamiensis]MDN8043673.1 hypothetical protein [Burkholderia vietnamiensis]UBI26640.1 hypothetical protein LA325_10245 [Burkholderia vietnamiensis]HDR9135126.1 hypothetical protein [Burkholderia vietnamiensis]